MSFEHPVINLDTLFYLSFTMFSVHVNVLLVSDLDTKFLNFQKFEHSFTKSWLKHCSRAYMQLILCPDVQELFC